VADFPKLLLEPGHYECRWFVRRRSYAGSIDLLGNRLPFVHLYDDHSRIPTVDFKAARHHPQLRGQLRNNMGVVAADAALHSFFPGQAYGRASYAIVGGGVEDIKDDRYDGLAVQITGLDPFIGRPPVERGDVPWPVRVRGRLRYPQVTQRPGFKYRSTRDSVVVSCGYDSIYPTSAHTVNVIFAPMVYIDSIDGPLTFAEWAERWIKPLVALVSFSTGAPQKVTIVTLTLGQQREQVHGAVFGGGIGQTPYPAVGVADWQMPDGRPYLTLATMARRLPSLLRKWGDLESGDNPFLDLYSYAFQHRDLPDRAAFLLRAQALEALHGYEARHLDALAQRRFTRDRAKLLRDLASSTGASQTLIREVDRLVGRSPRSSLAGNLKQLFNELPDTFTTNLDRPELRPLANRLRAARPHIGNGLHEELAALRNGLSHGESYPDNELQPWLRPIDLLCRATLMRLLRFKDNDIVAAVGNR
jgi:hypothetical protein